jgi:hypothetical protein
MFPGYGPCTNCTLLMHSQRGLLHMWLYDYYLPLNIGQLQPISAGSMNARTRVSE